MVYVPDQLTDPEIWSCFCWRLLEPNKKSQVSRPGWRQPSAWNPQPRWFPTLGAELRWPFGQESCWVSRWAFSSRTHYS